MLAPCRAVLANWRWHLPSRSVLSLRPSHPPPSSLPPFSLLPSPSSLLLRSVSCPNRCRTGPCNNAPPTRQDRPLPPRAPESSRPRVRSFPRDPRRRRRRRFFPHVLTEAGWGGTARRSQPVADGCRSGVSPLCDRPSEAGIAIQSGPAPAAAKGRPPPADLDGKKAPSGHDGSCQLAQPRLFPRPGAGITSVDKS